MDPIKDQAARRTSGWPTPKSPVEEGIWERAENERESRKSCSTRIARSGLVSRPTESDTNHGQVHLHNRGIDQH